MSKEQYAPIRFQLEESIWLDHHANAAEIISLELEPDVEVVEERDFVTIAGFLMLRGRFDTTSEEGDDSLDLESSSLAEQLQYQPLRLEQKEIFEEDFRGKIEKVFPVDVTVPLNKIDNIDDVFVKIDQFDYTVTDGHRLNIQADIEIIGILNEAREVRKAEEEQDKRESVQENVSSNAGLGAPLLPSFDVAASRDENADFDPQETREYEFKLSDHSGEPDPQLDRMQEVDNTVATQFEVSAERNETTVEEKEVRLVHKQLTEDNEQADEQADENIIPLFDQEIRTVFHSLQSDDEESRALDESGDDREEESTASQTTSFLTQLMSTREESEEEKYTKLKMCIIQRDESLDSISERYSIPIRDIMRVNHLESEQVTVGQILYIPKS